MNSPLLESERTNRFQARINSLSMEERMSSLTLKERMNSTLAMFSLGSTGGTDGKGHFHSAKQFSENT